MTEIEMCPPGKHVWTTATTRQPDVVLVTCATCGTSYQRLTDFRGD